jgi:hypothetical protein
MAHSVPPLYTKHWFLRGVGVFSLGCGGLWADWALRSSSGAADVDYLSKSLFELCVVVLCVLGLWIIGYHLKVLDDERPRLQKILDNKNRSFDEYLVLFPGACQNQNCGHRKLTFDSGMRGGNTFNPDWRYFDVKCTRCGWKIEFDGIFVDERRWTRGPASPYVNRRQRKQAVTLPSWWETELAKGIPLNCTTPSIGGSAPSGRR